MIHKAAIVLPWYLWGVMILLLLSSNSAYNAGMASQRWSGSLIADELHGWGPHCFHSFINHYWQRKPVLIRGAVNDIRSRLLFGIDDVYSLTCDDDVETRLIRHRKELWQKQYGPFSAGKLARLGQTNWTMLLQEVDRHVPRVADLWHDIIPFVPNWRRDDVMISYSVPGGGIGAHVDNYDVFLLQASGTREWSIENSLLSDLEEKRREIPNTDTRLLANFVADQTWILQPGDMLYLPPRVPHRGITLDGEACTTVSLGFRSPNMQYLVTAFWEDICKTNPEDGELKKFYNHHLQAKDGLEPGLLDPRTVEEIKGDIFDRMQDGLSRTTRFQSWLGKYLSSPLRFHQRKPRAFFLERNTVDEGLTKDFLNDHEINYDGEDNSIEDGIPLYLREPFRVASQKKFTTFSDLWSYIARGEGTLRRCEGIRCMVTNQALYINGEEYLAPSNLDLPEVGRLLCGAPQMSSILLRNASESPVFRIFMEQLLQEGLFYPVDD